MIGLFLVADRMYVNYEASSITSHESYPEACAGLAISGKLGHKILNVKLNSQLNAVSELTFIDKIYIKRGFEKAFEDCIL